MMRCEHHGTGACLVIDPDESVIEVDENGNLAMIEEHYECIESGITGIYRWIYGAETISGCILDDGEVPKPLSNYRLARDKRGEQA